MQMVKIADLKNNLSRHLARVRRGGEVIVYDRDRPVARIVPFVPEDARAGRDTARNAAATADRIADLVRQGVLSPGDTRALARWLDARAPRQRPAGSPSAVDVLLTMRRESTR